MYHFQYPEVYVRMLYLTYEVSRPHIIHSANLDIAEDGTGFSHLWDKEILSSIYYANVLARIKLSRE